MLLKHALGVFPCARQILEFCDRGSLADALRDRVFLLPAAASHQGGAAMLGAEGPALDMQAMLLVLMQAANAVAHLHSLGIVHCDIKVRDEQPWR